MLNRIRSRRKPLVQVRKRGRRGKWSGGEGLYESLLKKGVGSIRARHLEVVGGL